MSVWNTVIMCVRERKVARVVLCEGDVSCERGRKGGTVDGM